jgi:hypothetical protein
MTSMPERAARPGAVVCYALAFRYRTVDDRSDLGTKRALATGLVRGQRLLIAVTLISQAGGHSDGMLGVSVRGRLPGHRAGLAYGCPAPGPGLPGPELVEQRSPD